MNWITRWKKIGIKVRQIFKKQPTSSEDTDWKNCPQSKKISYKTINLGVPGYSPTMLKFKLKKLLETGVKPKKIFYLMDLTDVHDESNRWIKINDIDYPVILDKFSSPRSTLSSNETSLSINSFIPINIKSKSKCYG